MPVKRLCALVTDRGNPSSDLPFIGLEHIAGWTGEVRIDADAEAEGTVGYFRSGDILFGKLRPYLAKVARVEFDGTCSTEALVLRPHREVEPRFMRYALSTPDFIQRVNSATFGVKMPRASWETIGREEIALPDLATQKSIADFLDRETARIDGLIGKKGKLADLLDEKRKTLASAYAAHGVDQDARLGPTGIEALPNAPGHWRSLRIAQIFSEANERGEADLPVLSVSINWGISDRQLDDDDRHRVVSHIEDRTAYKRVRPNDLVYNMMRAWQGAFGVARVDGLVSPAYVVARPKADIHAAYFEHLLRSPLWIEEFRRASKGIADFRQRLYWENFRQVMVVLPPIEEQRAIAAEINARSAEIEAVMAKIHASVDRLTELRSALITAAVTGRIDPATWHRRGQADRALDRIEMEAAK